MKLSNYYKNNISKVHGEKLSVLLYFLCFIMFGNSTGVQAKIVPKLYKTVVELELIIRIQREESQI